MSRERFEDFDIVRGLAIVLIVVLHSVIPPFWNVYFSSFHLAQFFIFTGFFIERSVEKYSYREILWQRLNKILLPFVGFQILIFVYFVARVFIGESSFDIWGGFWNLLNSILYGNSYWINTRFGGSTFVWFLPPFFIFSVALWAIYKSVKNRWVRIGIGIACLLVAQLIFLQHEQKLFDTRKVIWGIDKVPLMLALGIFMADGFRHLLKYITDYKWIVLLVCSIFLYFTVGDRAIDLRILKMEDVFYYTGFAFLGFVLLFAISKIIISFDILPLRKLLTYVGRNSLSVYLSHSLIDIIIHAKFSPNDRFELSYTLTLVTLSIALVYALQEIGKYLYDIYLGNKDNINVFKSQK